MRISIKIFCLFIFAVLASQTVHAQNAAPVDSVDLFLQELLKDTPAPSSTPAATETPTTTTTPETVSTPAPETNTPVQDSTPKAAEPVKTTKEFDVDAFLNNLPDAPQKKADSIVITPTPQAATAEPTPILTTPAVITTPIVKDSTTTSISAEPSTPEITSTPTITPVDSLSQPTAITQPDSISKDTVVRPTWTIKDFVLPEPSPYSEKEQNMGYDYVYTADDYGDYDKYKLPAAGIGTGILTPFTDLGNHNPKAKAYGRNNTGIHLFAEQRYKNMWGGSFDILMGKLTQMNNSPAGISNFSSGVFAMNVNGVFHLDNDIILKKSEKFSPYVSLGLGFMHFNPKADLLDANNKKYFFWNTGTLMDRAYDPINPESAKQLTQDYKFETKLDPNKDHNHTTLIVPISGGITFKLWDQIEAKVATTYYFTGSDYIDNINPTGKGHFIFSKKNDNFFYASFSLQFNISGWMNPMNYRYKGVDFDAADNQDTDGDGVRDFDDQCQDTEKGLAISDQGCPLDDDNDGVPNSLDKELNTAPNASVDNFGVTWTDEMDIQRYHRDSLVMAGKMFINADSIGRSLNKIIKDVNQSNEVRLEEKALRTFTTVAAPVAGLHLVNYNNIYNADSIINVTPSDDYSSLPGKHRPMSSISYPADKDFKNDISFRIQIAALSSSQESNYFTRKFNLTNKVTIENDDKYYKYTIGNFSTYDNVAKSCDDFISKTNINAFVVAYKNGQRINLVDARKAISSDYKEVPDATDNTIIYRVQIASLGTNDKAEFFKNKFHITENLYVDPYKGSYKYSVGTFTSFDEAQKFSQIIKPQIGNVNSFVIALKNGQIINLWELLKDKQ